MRRPRLDLDGDGCNLHDHCLSCPFTYCQFDLSPDLFKKPPAPTKKALEHDAAMARIEAAQRQREARSVEILRLRASGMSLVAIAAAMGISHATVGDTITGQAQETFSGWLDARCIIEPGAHIYASDACRDYVEWAAGEGIPSTGRMTSAMLGRKLGKQFAPEGDRAGKRYLGVRLR